MAKKKKKIQNLMQKKNQAQQRKEFFSVFKRLMELAGSPHGFSYLPAHKLEEIYNTRALSVRIEKTPDFILYNSDFKKIAASLQNYLNGTFIPFFVGETRISLKAYFSIVYYFELFVQMIKDDDFEKAKLLKDELKVFTDTIEKRKNEASITLRKLMLAWTSMLTDVKHFFVWYKYSWRFEGIHPVNIFTICIEEAHKIAVTIDGNTRPAYRLGYCLREDSYIWHKIKPAAFKFRGLLSEMPMDVYIQEHALQRLIERLDCIPHFCFNSYLAGTLMVPFEVIEAGDNRNLVAFYTAGIKAGYLVTSVYEGVILIRSFLFLTMDNTPEGKKLAEITGLQKTDKQFLHIDKQSTFINSDIADNSNLKKIFIDAGCESLFKLKDEFTLLSDNKLSIADKMALFLGISDQGEDTQELV